MPAGSLRLLALDGGGVRGLSSLLILERLMETVNPEAPPKPCDYFDMIGGTSTGGLIAIMLGRLKMSVTDCIASYSSLSDEIFQKKAHKLTIRGDIQGRFAAEELERAVKKVIKAQGLHEDALLKDDSTEACKVFVCATSKETNKTVCLTSYRTQRGNNDLLNDVKIWQACRATSAASSFFDPISIGRFGEEFVDGATGANNPVRELWDQAQVIWGPQPLDSNVRCILSIGTGVPSIQPFKDDLLNIHKTLVAIATETEQTSESFQREHTALDSTGRYYRLNVNRGLEQIGLEESKKLKDIAAATRTYLEAPEVHKKIQAFAHNLAQLKYSNVQQKVLDLEGVPRVRAFVDRPAEIANMERALLPSAKENTRQKIHILHGLGGIGKTQLSVEFARLHHHNFSSTFWLNGQTEDQLKQSLANCARRISSDDITRTSEILTVADTDASVDALAQQVLKWLAQAENSAWLLIIDNVDREYHEKGGDPHAYDVRKYLPSTDHGSILITTRLARMGQLGTSQHLGKVDQIQAGQILDNWYKTHDDPASQIRLLELLDGLPLAIAQAGAYLQESGVGLTTYLGFYEKHWHDLMQTKAWAETPLQDYPDRSVWTTWAISFQAIREKHEPTANLLLLWSFFDNRDLWYGMFKNACNHSEGAARLLSAYLGDIATNEIAFTQAMQLLRSYSLIEKQERMASYATHPVVHTWTYHYQRNGPRGKLPELAVISLGCTLVGIIAQENPVLQRRLLPHFRACLGRLQSMEARHFDSEIEDQATCHESALESAFRAEGKDASKDLIIRGFAKIAILLRDQDNLDEAEQTYEIALRMFGEELDTASDAFLNISADIATLYMKQGKLIKAEELCKRAMRRQEELTGPDHTMTLIMVNHLGRLYANQRRDAEAEGMFSRALRGHEETLGPHNFLTLVAVNNMGLVYKRQGKYVEADAMYRRALEGYTKIWGSKHTQTLDVVTNLGLSSIMQKKYDEASNFLERAMNGYAEALGPQHTSTLKAVDNLGGVYLLQNRLEEAERLFEQARQGYEKLLSKEALRTFVPALTTFENFGDLYFRQRKFTEARECYTKVLEGYLAVFGPTFVGYVRVAEALRTLDVESQTPVETSEAAVQAEQSETTKVEPPKKKKGLKASLLELKGRLR